MGFSEDEPKIFKGKYTQNTIINANEKDTTYFYFINFSTTYFYVPFKLIKGLEDPLSIKMLFITTVPQIKQITSLFTLKKCPHFRT